MCFAVLESSFHVVIDGWTDRTEQTPAEGAGCKAGCRIAPQSVGFERAFSEDFREQIVRTPDAITQTGAIEFTDADLDGRHDEKLKLRPRELVRDARMIVSPGIISPLRSAEKTPFAVVEHPPSHAQDEAGSR